MADALCGPSNPLQSFQKHALVDRTLQQDRLTARQSPAQAFRSQPGPNAGILDAEFEAFQAGQPIGPTPFNYQTLPYNTFGGTYAPDPPDAAFSDWASDFQRAHRDDILASPVPQSQFRQQAPLQRHTSAGWHNEFMRQQGQHFNNQGNIQQRPGLGNLNPLNEMGQSRYSPLSPVVQQEQPNRQFDEIFDEEAFERAFDAAKLETERSEEPVQQSTELNQETHDNGTAEDVLLNRLVDPERLGSDTIPENSHDNDADDLARTAGQLLDNLKHDQSQKFRDSSFLSLMRKIRDREVQVEGDELVDTFRPQPLHPGGEFYPERSDTTMSGAINSSDHAHNLSILFEPGLSAPPLGLHRTNLARSKNTIKLSATRDSSDGSSVSDKISLRALEAEIPYTPSRAHTPPPASSLIPASPPPPPFSSLYFPSHTLLDSFETAVTEPDSCALPAFCPAPPFDSQVSPAARVEAETKAALPPDTKGEGSSKGADDGEPPPPYTEGSSPLDSFTYVMAAAGGAASIITQVQQGGAAPATTLGDVGADEHITLDLRGTRFTLSRDELLTLPEFVLLSLFPNGLLPDGGMNSFHEGDVYPVDYDPASLQYMLEFFRTVAQTIPSNSSSPSPATEPTENHTTPASAIEAAPGSARDMLQDRAGIIVLREDLDFYAIPPKAEIDQPEMIEVKRAAGRALLGQDGIFSGLRRSEETGTTEQHLIEMLTAGGFYNDDRWGHRAGEPNKAVICSLALARLRTDIRGGELANSNAVGMAQKLLLFWRKPARRCWWEGVELEGVDGVEGKLKVWIRRVWTLEMSVIGLR